MYINLGRKKIENMLFPTKVCTFYELSETIFFFFGLRYLHLDLSQFLHRYLSLHVQFVCMFSKVKLRPSSGRQCPSFDIYLEIIYLSEAMLGTAIKLAFMCSRALFQ